MAIYSTSFVVTRYSVHHGLTPYDLVALRYAVAGLILLPVFCRVELGNLNRLGWHRGLTLSLLAGAPYMILFIQGLKFAPASHGAVLINGLVPTVVFLNLVLLGHRRFSWKSLAPLIGILIGMVLVSSPSPASDPNVLLGDALFIVAGLSWGWFTLLTKHWKVPPSTCTAIISVISMFLYLPLYFLFFYKGFETASMSHILWQALFQGVVNSILTLYLFAYGIHILGAQMTALFNPMVPILSTFLAIPVLAEIPTPLQWIGVATVVSGMLIFSRLDSSAQKT